ncbi:hypothetical protein SFRURICE_021134 [Spodoptera frugiperda]|nr:hypothetical protein SFRURICE_021134 [Spodoptera frugiperda]
MSSTLGISLVSKEPYSTLGFSPVSWMVYRVDLVVTEEPTHLSGRQLELVVEHRYLVHMHRFPTARRPGS